MFTAATDVLGDAASTVVDVVVVVGAAAIVATAVFHVVHELEVSVTR